MNTAGMAHICDMLPTSRLSSLLYLSCMYHQGHIDNMIYTGQIIDNDTYMIYIDFRFTRARVHARAHTHTRTHAHLSLWNSKEWYMITSNVHTHTRTHARTHKRTHTHTSWFDMRTSAHWVRTGCPNDHWFVRMHTSTKLYTCTVRAIMYVVLYINTYTQYWSLICAYVQ
jgi:hypothetical protein